ncbi:MAG: tripartite tricarboxylate transporter substrate binding protein [Delftia acidovorans]|nr:tripartite tricarboxylate transporter substrate binding protein [Delftia acidovorans]
MNKHIAGAIILALASLLAHAQANDFPRRSITIIDPYPAGGSTDVLSRLLGEQMSRSLGQPIVVEARPGAAGTIGSAQVARARPDGYTLLVGNPGPNAIAASAFSKLSYDVERDFAPIMIAATVPVLFCVGKDSPLKKPADLIAMGKSGKPANFGSTGPGGISHILGELFNRDAGTHFSHIPYKGAAPMSVAIMSGELDFGMLTGPDAMPHVRGGKMRCIATAGAERSPHFPDVPTWTEAGVPGIKIDVWFGYLAPAGTPAAIIDRLHGAMEAALATPAVKSRLDELSIAVKASTPQAFAQRIRADRELYGGIVRAINLRLD